MGMVTVCSSKSKDVNQKVVLDTKIEKVKRLFNLCLDPERYQMTLTLTIWTRRAVQIR
jgi:hypothetical protein